MPPDGSLPEVSLRPLAEGDAEALRRIRAAPEVLRWWGPLEDGFPGSDDPEASRLAIEAGGRLAGMIQYGEETDPRYRHAWIDLFLDPELRGRGIGTEAVGQLVRMLIDERGHHRITIDPAADNGPAIRAYEKVGFRPVGIMRSAERDVEGDGWHDSLLMDLLAGEEPR